MSILKWTIFYCVLQKLNGRQRLTSRLLCPAHHLPHLSKALLGLSAFNQQPDNKVLDVIVSRMRRINPSLSVDDENDGEEESRNDLEARCGIAFEEFAEGRGIRRNSEGYIGEDNDGCESNENQIYDVRGSCGNSKGVKIIYDKNEKQEVLLRTKCYCRKTTSIELFEMKHENIRKEEF